MFINKDGIPTFDGIKIIKEPPDFMCLICCNDEELVSVFLPCEHKFCIDCYRMYIEGKIDKRNISLLKCPDPNCKVTLSENDIKQIVSEDYFNRYLEYSSQSFVTSRNDIHWCPFPNC